LDSSIYTKNHPLRIYGCYKADDKEDRIKQWNSSFIFQNKKIKTKLELEDNPTDLLEDYAILQASLITFTEHCKVIKISIPKNNIVLEEANEETVVKAMELFKTIDKEEIFDLAKVDGNFICLKRKTAKTPYYCPVCEHNHENENPYLLIVGDNILFNCRRNERHFILGKGVVMGEKKIEIEKEDDYFENAMKMRRRMGGLSGIKI